MIGSRKVRGALAALALPLALAACQANPETVSVASQPKTVPVKNITSFSDALRCMDDLFVLHGKRDIVITSPGLPDATQKISAGTKEMLITAVSRMSVKSNAFRFVDFDTTQADVNVLFQQLGFREGFQFPNYYMRGAVTQLDDSVLSGQEGFSIATPFAELGLSRDQIVSVVTIDMNMVDMVSRQVMPGMSATNSIAVVRSGKGADAGGRIGKAGLAFNVSMNNAEGPSQAVRTLIELSAIEVLGKLTRVPYWKCLQIDQTNPEVMQQAREWYDTMTVDQRDTFVTAGLRGLGYLQAGAPLNDAVARFQADNDLIATGRHDFDVYYRLLGKGTDTAGAGQGWYQDAVAAGGRPAAPPAPPPPPAERMMTMSLGTDRGPQPTFRLGEVVVAQASLTNAGYLYCFYRDTEGTIVRLHPNRFAPDAYTPAQKMVEMPPRLGADRPFNLRASKPGSEEIACFATQDEVGPMLPDWLKGEDLKPIRAESLDAIGAAFSQVNRSGMTNGRLPITVTP